MNWIEGLFNNANMEFPGASLGLTLIVYGNGAQ